MRVKNPAAKLYRKFLLLSKNNLNEDAIFYLKKAAKKGHAAAQFELGWLYKKGQYVNKDIEKTLVLWRAASEQGFSKAQVMKMATD